MDNRSKEDRSKNMSNIHSNDTKPEAYVRKYLFSKGFRYRKNVKSLPGKPDIVLPKYKTIIFVNGCFWHAHEGCKWFVPPKTRVDFWKTKFQYNKSRDKMNYIKLKELGWRVFVIWECEIRHNKHPEEVLDKLIYLIKHNAEASHE